jgi:hypothetical protein
MSARSPGSDRHTSSPARVEGQPAHVEYKLTYQVILRHLAKFRDGAHHLLELIREHVPGLDDAVDSVVAPEGVEAPEAVPKSPLELRIDRHMGAVDRALVQINKLNPDHKRKAELPPEIREQIVLKERTIHDIVSAELHFWAAAIESAPLDRFDPVERSWVARIIRLARVIGVDADHKEHLDFLESWAAQEHS